MNEYRTTETLTAEGTFVVAALASLPPGTEAEIVVRVADVPAGSESHPLRRFLANLRPELGQRSTADEEQAFLRQLKDEWR